MKKRLLKVAVTTALTVAFAVPAFAAAANPFSDVPAKHWAYDAVSKLAQAGIVDGYGDGTFKGDKTMTRYEMAQIVAKAMNKSLNADQQATVNQLSKEFATELNNLGVKVDGLQNQVNNMVKISGDARLRYFNVENAKDYTDYRARVTFDGKISDNLKFNARLAGGTANADGRAANVTLDTANVKFAALGMDNTVGRQDLALGSGYLANNQMNGIAAQAGGLKLFAGNMSYNYNAPGVSYTGDDAKGFSRIYGAEYKFNAMGAKVTADYLKDNNNSDEFYGANASFGLAKNVSANVEYLNNNEKDATALAYGVKFDKAGLSATYRDVEAGAYTKFSGMNVNGGGDTGSYGALSTGFKGMEYQYNKAFDKNANLTVTYQDFENQDGVKLDGRTSAVVNVKF